MCIEHEYPYEQHHKSLEGPHGDPGESSTAVVLGVSNEVPSKVKNKKQPKEQYKCTIGQCAERLCNFPSWLRHHCTEHEEHPGKNASPAIKTLLLTWV